MNYRHIYMLIIEHAKSEEKLGLRKKGNGNYYEKHHILPKSLFPLWSKKKSNLVLLTAREHFFCHQLLTKIYPSRAMSLALWYLMNDNQNNCCSSREYEYLKNKLIKNKTFNTFEGKHHSETVKITISKALRGRKLTDEQRKHLSDINKGEKSPKFGKKVSEETRLKMSKAQQGKKRNLTDEQRKQLSERAKLNHQKTVEARRLKNNYKISKEACENRRQRWLINNPMSKKVYCKELNIYFNSLSQCSEYFLKLGYKFNAKILSRYIKNHLKYKNFTFLFC